MGTHTGERLVDGVVHNFIYQMVQAAGAGGADIHARAFAYRLESFQYLYLAFVVHLVVGAGHRAFEGLVHFHFRTHVGASSHSFAVFRRLITLLQIPPV